MLVHHKEEIFEWIVEHIKERSSSSESGEEGEVEQGNGNGDGPGKQIVNQNRGIRAVGSGEL